MLELMVLASLMSEPSHGYELKRLLSGFNPNNNQIYPLLARLEREGSVTVRTEEAEGKPSRKVYSITPGGRKRMMELLGDFDGKDDDGFYLRVAFFQFLERSCVEEILRIREQALENYFEENGVMAGMERIPDTAYDIRFLRNYLGGRVSGELRFIEALREKYGIEKKSAR